MKYSFDCITDFIFACDELSKADVILIPWGIRKQLIEKAVELYNDWYAPLILPSGGKWKKLTKMIKSGKVDFESEWEYLKNIAVSLWVFEKNVLKEDQAIHTFDNARLSLRVLLKEKIDVKKVILVSKAHHARRALLTYQTEFPQDVEFMVCPIVDDRNVSRDNWFLEKEKIDIVMKEVEKIWKYFGKHIPNWVRD